MPHPIPTAPVGVDADVWEATVAEVRASCGWHIAPSVEETVTVDGPGTHLLVLPTLHLTDLTDVTDDGSAVTSPEWSRTGMVRRPFGCWTHKFRGVTATMTHGYDEWPADLLAVMAEMATPSSTTGVAKALTSGPYQVTFEESMRPSQREVLGRYKLPSYGA